MRTEPPATGLWSHQKLEGPLVEPPEGAWPCHTVTLDFGLQNRENTLLWLKPPQCVVVGYGSPRTLIHPRRTLVEASQELPCCLGALLMGEEGAAQSWGAGSGRHTVKLQLFTCF